MEGGSLMFDVDFMERKKMRELSMMWSMLIKLLNLFFLFCLCLCLWIGVGCT